MSAPRASVRIPLSAPEIGGNEWKYVKECLDGGWVSSVGAFVTRFERELAALTGSPHAVAVVNGTAALHVALRAVGVEPGDEVLVPTLTFAAPANAVTYTGAVPVFMDAGADWQMDAAKVERFLAEETEPCSGGRRNKRTGRRVRAIVPVHLLGMACEVDRLVAAARVYGLKVVEDAAEGTGVRYKGRHVGTFGDAGCFSFNGNKIATAGGGGMVVTPDPELARRVRHLTTQAKADPVEYLHDEIGYNYRLTNIQAAVGVAQLEQLPRFVERRRFNAAFYREAFAGIDILSPIPLTPHTEPTYWLYTVLMAPGTASARRADVVRRLNELGIEARPLWHTLHDQAPYRSFPSYGIERAPDLYARAISLPSSSSLTREDLERVAEAVRESVS
jgi:perosamine synthetase